MEIRKATAEEMLALWGFENEEKASPTARFFAENLRTGNAEFWTMVDAGSLIGELYAFRNLDDKDFADGSSRAYLCAFRIRKEYRRQGLGSRLMETVLSHLKAEGFDSVTIGVDETEDDNIRLYRRHGFNEKIKDCFEDPCDVDENMQPKTCPCFWLLRNSL